MDVMAIRVSDFLFNMGNTVFNVRDVKYRQGNDLDYEESNSLPINMVFYSLEDKMKYYKNKMHLLMNNIFSIFKKLFSIINFKSKKKVQQNQLNNIHKSYAYNNCTAHTVISNNVRNRLLKTINEDINIYNSKVENTNFIKPKKLKNQFKSDMIVNEDKP